MASRTATIWICDRCNVEKEQLGTCPWNGHLWFRHGAFATSSTESGELKRTELLCDTCITQLHEWWNKGNNTNRSTTEESK